ncbi:MAG: FtsX-like permease family protein [Candidatus Acididesulfobacter guangdongensis]|uniref:FtsX-like permease family protein n=1 Tax=Acididesulfobacter guangdongensis TaxID=2597225 RepID=A0A519BF56_ACIG2|nr:MAG: FtsX-like permease family protein [Candidatus Acididesulfobacter guangdongensis]
MISQKINYLNNYIKIAFLNIKSNIAGNIFALSIMSFSFFIMLFFMLSYINIYNYMLSFEKNNTMIIFLKNLENTHSNGANLTNRITAANIINKIKKFKGVKKVKYYSNKLSYKFMLKHTPNIKTILAKIKPSYFPRIIKIYFKPNYISKIYLSNIYLRLKSMRHIKFVYYSKLMEDKINQFVFFTKMIGFIVLLFLFISSVFVSYSAIKLIILRKQNDIEILKLIGATNNYIKIPMYIESAMGSVIAFILSLILLSAIFNIFIYYKFNKFLSFFKINIIFLNGFDVLIIFFIALLSGFLGTYFSSRKFF